MGYGTGALWDLCNRFIEVDSWAGLTELTPVATFIHNLPGFRYTHWQEERRIAETADFNMGDRTETAHKNRWEPRRAYLIVCRCLLQTVIPVIIGVRSYSHTNCYGKTWRPLCPFFRNLHLRENLARYCFTSTTSTVTDSVQNIFTRLRYCDKWTVATLNNNLV